MVDGLSVLVQLRAAVSLGRFQSVRAERERAAERVHCLPAEVRAAERDVVLRIVAKSNRNVSFRVLRGFGLVPIQLVAPRWKPGVGSG